MTIGIPDPPMTLRVRVRYALDWLRHHAGRVQLAGPPSWRRVGNDKLRLRGCRVLPLPRGWRLVWLSRDLAEL